MLDGAAWEAARPTICRTLGRTPNVADEINGLSERLDAAYRLVAGNLLDNASVAMGPALRPGNGAALTPAPQAEDAAAAKRFLAKALGRQNHPVPRVIIQ